MKNKRKTKVGPGSSSSGVTKQRNQTQAFDQECDSSRQYELIETEEGEMWLVPPVEKIPDFMSEAFPIVSPLATEQLFSIRPPFASDRLPFVYAAARGTLRTALEGVRKSGYRYHLNYTEDGAGFFCAIAKDESCREAATWWAFATNKASGDCLWRIIVDRHARYRRAESQYPKLPLKPSFLPWLYYDCSCLDHDALAAVGRLSLEVQRAAWCWLYKQELKVSEAAALESATSTKHHD